MRVAQKRGVGKKRKKPLPPLLFPPLPPAMGGEGRGRGGGGRARSHASRLPHPRENFTRQEEVQRLRRDTSKGSPRQVYACWFEDYYL